MSELGDILRELGRFLPIEGDDARLAPPKMVKATLLALPLDCREWFLAESGIGKITYLITAVRLINWLYKDVKKLSLNLKNVERIRKARVEWFEELVQVNLPSQSVMVYLDQNMMERYSKLKISDNLIDCLMKDLQTDKDRLLVGVGLSMNSGYINYADLGFMERMTKQVPTITQSLLIELDNEPEQTEDQEKEPE